MKKFLSILLSLTLLLSVVALPIGAVDAAAMYTETSAGEVSAGDTFTYTISLSGSYMGYACSIPVIDGLTVETITKSDTDLGKATNVDKKADGSYLLSVLPSFDTTDAEKSLIATVTVKVNDDATVGTITLSLDEVQVANSVGDKVADLQTHFASISVVEKSVPVAVTGVALDQTTAEMNIGDTLTLHATVSPDNADNKSVTWKSDNTTVAAVANGVVTAKAAGSANITVTTADGGFTASCAITVKEDTPIEDAAAIVVHAGKAMAGKTIDVTIELKNNPGIASISFDMSYDANVMSIETIDNTGLFGTAMDSGNYSLNPYKFVWTDFALNNHSENGIIATVTFKIKEDTPEGDYAVTLSYGNGDIVNRDSENVMFTVVNDDILVRNYTPGDVNDDGIINMLDAIAVIKYYAKWDGYGEDALILDAADVNNDQIVNMLDAIAIIKHYAKWSGYETLPIQ